MTPPCLEEILRLQLPAYLNKRVRVFKRITVRLWFILGILLISLTGIIVKIILHRSVKKPDTIMTLVNMDLENKFSITTEELSKVPISRRRISSELDSVFQDGCRDVGNTDDAKDDNDLLNAALVVLSRNSELDDVIKSMQSLELHFNQWFHYPWIFLNDEDHSQEFKDTVKKYTDSEVQFGTIPKALWDFPDSVYDAEFQEHIKNQGDRGIMYGQMESYHKMCRFYSKNFFKHELIQNLEWYWRVEPDVEFYCDLTYDPFKEMAKQNKRYGFTVIIRELQDTVPNLFRYTKAFIEEAGITNSVGDAWQLFTKNWNFYEGKNKDLYKGIDNVSQLITELAQNVKISKFIDHASVNEGNPETVLDPDILQQLVTKSTRNGLPEFAKQEFDKEEYNLCHFWSNFEIAKTEIFDNPLYDQYIEFLENSGGFYKERWGDAPIHSLAVGVFLNLSEIHYFRDIGYRHSTIRHCPSNSPEGQLPFPDNYPVVPPRDLAIENGVGCRCKCPNNNKEVEDSKNSCMGQWINLNSAHRDTLNSKLDLDRIEELIGANLDTYYAEHGNFKDWTLSNDEIIALSKQRITI